MGVQCCSRGKDCGCHLVLCLAFAAVTRRQTKRWVRKEEATMKVNRDLVLCILFLNLLYTSSPGGRYTLYFPDDL